MVDPSGIYQWRRLNQRLTTSGQPSEDGLKEISGLGTSCIVNLGTHNHERALEDEAASVAALGMRYIHIPVEFNAPTDAHFEKFCAVTEALQGKTVHIHCIANLRVTAFLYRYQRDIQNKDEIQARALMDSVWRPGGVWAAFIGDMASVPLEHRPPA